MTTQARNGSEEAFVTLCCNDAYAVGALVWAQSLLEVGTKRDIVVMVTSQLSSKWREALKRVCHHVETVDLLDSHDVDNLRLLQRAELGLTFTKLHCWRLVQYKKAVFMDADTLVLQNIDDLFDREELSAVPDPGWPDCFNSGVFVYRPSLETYEKIIEFATKRGSFDGGDQGLLNMFFADWSRADISRRLSFVYNCVSHSFYTYAPALAYFRSQVRVVHFIGPQKPWKQAFRVQLSEQPEKGSALEFLYRWWRLYKERVQPSLSDSLQSDVSAGGFDTSTRDSSSGGTLVHSGPTVSTPLISDRERQYAWECGHIDYTGSDRFQNIQAKLDVTMRDASPSAVGRPRTGSGTASDKSAGHSGITAVAPKKEVAAPKKKSDELETIVSKKHGEEETTTSKKPAEKETTASKKPAEKETIASKKSAEMETTASKKPVEKETTASKKPVEKETTASKKPAEKESGNSKKPAEKERK